MELDLPQILKFSWGDKPKLEKAWNEDDLQWNMTSSDKKWNISATTDWISPKF